MIRNRDVFAVITLVALTRWAWKDPIPDASSASLRLAWYLPRSLVSVLDIDGDGRPEALAVLIEQNSEWSLQLRDLKPVHHPTVRPKIPPLLYEASIPQRRESPLALTTGHVSLHALATSSLNNPLETYQGHKVTERTQHYFCGKDWHEASQSCKKPCPSGQAEDCENGDRCFADTACNLHDFVGTPVVHKKEFTLTPRGSVPATFALWPDGSVLAHSLQGESTLSFGSLWETQLPVKDVDDWQDVTLQFVDATDAGTPHGLLLVAATIESNDELSSLLVALDGATGKVLWVGDNKEESHVTPEQFQLPFERGTHSFARRRARLAIDEEREEESLPNCLTHYRRSLLTSGVLPYGYFAEEDARIDVVHFDVQQKHTKKHHKKHHKAEPIRARPNVVVAHNQQGLHVHSLKNGRPLCHLTLWENTLYADLNHDAVLDSVGVITGRHRLPGEEDVEDKEDLDKWIDSLIKNVASQSELPETHQAISSVSMCHGQALSGVPAKEQLFSVPVCGRRAEMADDEATPAPPLAVQSWRGHRHGSDVIFAMSNGIISRFRGSSGRRQWTVVGSKVTDFPTWEDPEYVLLSQIGSENILSASRPILLSGETSLAVLPPRHGVVLATAVYPQPLSRKPLLVDFSGDGTSDVIAWTKDAVWGYQVHVRTSATSTFRVIVGLLMMVMMLALLRNRFGPNPGRRSTDQ